MLQQNAYPLHFKGELTVSPNSGLWLIKWLLAIPHFFILVFLWIGFVVAWVIALFAIVFTSKYPRGLFDYNVGFYAGRGGWASIAMRSWVRTNIRPLP